MGTMVIYQMTEFSVIVHSELWIRLIRKPVKARSNDIHV